jgi:hypothetical protein
MKDCTAESKVLKQLGDDIFFGENHPTEMAINEINFLSQAVIKRYG